jgi:hypothetical protein
MRTNFTECAIRYSANTSEGQSLRSQWGWHGPLLGLERNESTQISREGCKRLCGTGIDAYPWNDASNTITTWILPVVGTLLQAPFESNAFKRTVWAITRWVGSPIASLSYVLWNIKVSAKAALMVDMAVRYDETPERRSHFGSMRDSMYLLLAMTQYTMNPAAIKREKEAEGLLRIALFSKDLKLTDTNQKLRHMRRILARELREMRRRGVVPGLCSPACIHANAVTQVLTSDSFCIYPMVSVRIRTLHPSSVWRCGREPNGTRPRTWLPASLVPDPHHGLHRGS